MNLSFDIKWKLSKENMQPYRASMRQFRHFIADKELRDLYLHGRRYTWSNEREAPTLERIDRVLCTAGWASDHPSYMLRRLSSTASDHAPLFIDALPRSSKHMRFHFERFWPSLPGYHDTVAQAWSSVPHEPDPFRCIFAKLRATARCLQRWGSRTVGNVSLQLFMARELIARLDAMQDMRVLSPVEAWFRRKLKASYLGLASLERSLARQ